MAEVAKKDTKPAFQVVNTVRRVGTRLHRALSPRRQRWQLWVAGQRLLRNKRLPLTEEQFLKERDHLHKLVLSGKAAVITPDNVKVTTTPDGRYVLTKMGTGATKLLEQGEVPACFGEKKVAKPQPKPAPAPETPAEEWPKEELPKAEPEEASDPKSQDLTALPGIGGGRAKKLEGVGVTAYSHVVECGVAGMMEILGITKDVAEEIVAAATKLDS
jgi:predicted flap endonuclease-1-like 5' DNA nuclease